MEIVIEKMTAVTLLCETWGMFRIYIYIVLYGSIYGIYISISIWFIYMVYLSRLDIFSGKKAPSVCNQVGWFHHFEDPEILGNSVWFLVFFVLNLSECKPGPSCFISKQESPESDRMIPQYDVVLYYTLRYHIIVYSMTL